MIRGEQLVRIFLFEGEKQKWRGKREYWPCYIGSLPSPDILSLPFPREMAPPSKKLLVSPWQIFNSTAAWKNRILPMVGDTTSPIPHPAISATLRRGEGGGSALRGHLDTRSWEILFRPRS